MVGCTPCLASADDTCPAEMDCGRFRRGPFSSPASNAVIRSVAVSALNRGWEVVGVRRGYQGLLENDPEAIIPLDRERVPFE